MVLGFVASAIFRTRQIVSKPLRSSTAFTSIMIGQTEFALERASGDTLVEIFSLILAVIDFFAPNSQCNFFDLKIDSQAGTGLFLSFLQE